MAWHREAHRSDVVPVVWHKAEDLRVKEQHHGQQDLLDGRRDRRKVDEGVPAWINIFKIILN